ncbi:MULTISPECIES: DUF4255 domain-containing protein [Cohnella]|uniref:DUF4255 domain-containing protein n=1 Tax=Cohnella TaxID=329857 RepID=UPI0009BA6652|nr:MULTISPECIES: DUF4255 domain-containing protein [Cohnella]MBN2982768.1 DUF4255 domain-containing protein [Cohnella algarum]
MADFRALCRREAIRIGSYTVFADVGASVLKLLREQMTPDPVPRPDLIGIASPVDKGDLALTLFLCSIRENGEARRSDMQLQGGVMRYPPLAVDLHFLLTAHSTADLQTRTLDEHRLLGRAMQVLYDNSILRPPYLEGTLADNEEELRITAVTLDPDQAMRHWQFGDTPYKLSLLYRVGPVLLESNRSKPVSRVVERKITLRDKGEI